METPGILGSPLKFNLGGKGILSSSNFLPEPPDDPKTFVLGLMLMSNPFNFFPCCVSKTLLTPEEPEVDLSQ